MAHRVSDRLSLWKDLLLLQGARQTSAATSPDSTATHTAYCECWSPAVPLSLFTVCMSVSLTHSFHIRPSVSLTNLISCLSVCQPACSSISPGEYLSVCLSFTPTSVPSRTDQEFFTWACTHTHTCMHTHQYAKHTLTRRCTHTKRHKHTRSSGVSSLFCVGVEEEKCIHVQK